MWAGQFAFAPINPLIKDEKLARNFSETTLEKKNLFLPSVLCNDFKESYVKVRTKERTK